MDINEALKIISEPCYLPTHSELEHACIKFTESSNLVDNLLLWDTATNKKESPVFEIWNRDYIDLLAKYLTSRVPTTILEVGAGNGKLSHNLRQRIVGIDIIATDNASWKINAAFPVENMEIAEALAKYQPDIVISSWMPYCHDWTPLFRACNSVKEYILIGETDGGCCGADSTWGVSENWDEDIEPAYKQEGFIRNNLNELSELQICRTDRFVFGLERMYRHSRTVSFKRALK